MLSTFDVKNVDGPLVGATRVGNTFSTTLATLPDCQYSVPTSIKAGLILGKNNMRLLILTF